jgi:hypothetical protein
MRIRLLALSLVAALASAGGALAKTTVCTITVNSADEKETFRQNLPKDKYQFVELVEKGRQDWLASSCQKGVQCDVLVVSGHFNAGETFYSDRLANDEYLAVDELERAACSESCPALFGRLKEVYLFGCESLNPDATNYSSAYGESGRDRMRRIFWKTPAIYGFYSSAPVGPTAAMLLGRYFASSSPGEIFTGRPSPRLLSIFSRNHMTVTSGSRDASKRQDICTFYDERLAAAQKVEFVHGVLRRDMAEVRGYVERIEKLFESFNPVPVGGTPPGEDVRKSAAFVAAMERLSADRVARDRYLSFARSRDSSTRARMVALAHTLGWLPPDEHRAELVRLANDVIAGPMSFVEVDLLCSLNRERELDREIANVRVPAARSGNVHQAAALACLGSRDAHSQVMRALASGDDKEVQAVQAYLRHRPPARDELRSVALEIARRAGNGSSVRALDTLARLHIADREVLEELVRSFAAARSVNVQRAIAEVFLRSDPKALPARELAATLRQHRLRAPGGGEDLIDVLLRKLQG